jgi:anti-sigma factor RsiW
MMTEDQKMRLQAWVDGELRGGERRQVESWLAQDANAQAWVADLRAVARCLAAHETPRPVPESREFYWSKIARAIELELAADEAVQRFKPWASWRRWWVVPAAALSLLALGGFLLTRALPDRQSPAVLAVASEIETPLKEVSSFSFRAESERMTVVWVNFRSD